MDYPQIYEYELGVKFTKRSGLNWMAHCPLPNHEDRNPSFSVNVETGQCKCFSCQYSGNTYTLAKELSHDNPHKFIDNNNNGHIRRDRPIKSEIREPIMTIDEVEKKKENYFDNLDDKWKDESRKHECDFGITNDGRYTFHYPTAIKIHKGKPDQVGVRKNPYWIGIDKECQIFGLNRINTKEEVIIFEGEKDVINVKGFFNAITFSHGAGNVPKDLSALEDVPSIIVLGDNDEYGEKHNKAVAHQFYLMGIPVKIATWDKSLPSGFDPSDDLKMNTTPIEISKAIYKAVEYVPSVNKETESENINQKGYEVMNVFEYIEAHSNPPQYICEHLLVENGVSLVAGTDGVGKTWFGLQMAIAIASGKPFLDFSVRRKKVLVIQFELSSEQLADRLKRYDLNGTEGHLDFVVLSDKDLIFSESWTKISRTIQDTELKNGVVFIDNLYTSTNADVSNNQDLKPLLKNINLIKTTSGNAFVLIGHNNKADGDKEPILTKNIITGGKTLTNYVSNVFQIGNSSMGADVRRGKITKTRDSYTDLEHTPLRLEWNPDKCLFTRQGVITNEVLHTIQLKKQWEIKILIELADRLDDKDDFDRQYLMAFIESEFPDDLPDTNYKKGTRWLNKMESFGLIRGRSNRYTLNREEIRLLETESNNNK